MSVELESTQMESETTLTSRSTGCGVIALFILFVLPAIGIPGFIWLSVVNPTALGIPVPAEWFTLGTTLGYSLWLILPFGLVVMFLRKSEWALWRGVALSVVLTGGYILLAGLILFIDRALPFPGLPAWLQALIPVFYSAVCLFLLKQHVNLIPGSRIFLGAGIGLLVSLGWFRVGALGILPESISSVVEALSISLITTIGIISIFAYDRAFIKDHPRWSIGLAGSLLSVMQFGTLAVRGYVLQGNLIAWGFVFIGFIATSLFVMEQTNSPQKGWANAWVCLFFAYLIPFLFTEGFEGDFMLEEMGVIWGSATLISAILVIGLSVALFLLIEVLTTASRSVWVTGSVFMGAFILSGMIYLLLGQPGGQADTYLVVLHDQADTRFALDIEDRDERVSAVYDTLTTHAIDTQGEIRTYLIEQGVAYTPYYIINSIEVQGGNPLIRRYLATHPDVATILTSPHTRPLPDSATPADLSALLSTEAGSDLPWGIESMGADRVWDEFNIHGEGIVIGIADSGVDWLHDELNPSYLGTTDDHTYTWYDPWYNTSEPEDTLHGTHVAGIALGESTGVAPSANWIACRNLARNLGNPAFYMECMQFLFAPFPPGSDPFIDGEPARGAHIVNNSWGCPPEEGCDGTTLSIGLEHLYHAGQIYVISAGNSGPQCSTIGAPAVSQSALVIGAVAQSGQITGFSSRGPITIDDSGRPKPDVVAPGAGILSSIPGGTYAFLDGTSMASPHVSGMVALLWSSNPGLIGDVDRTKQIIIETSQYVQAENPCGLDTNDQNNVYGFGRVDAYEAVKMALELP